MEWDKGYSALYYATILDKTTMYDVDRIEITGGSIKRTTTDLRESADLNCVDYDISTEQYVRVWLDTKQEGASSHTPLFTGIATSPSRDINGRYITNTLECYSILKIAQDILLPRGWYAPAGTDGGALVAKLLEVIGVNIDVAPNAPSLASAIIAEDGENNLSMSDKILNAMNWRMKLDGYGNIAIEPYDRDRLATFNPITNDILEPSLTITYDWFNCPNVFRAVSDNQYAIARDESPDSPYSIPNRGREIWAEETSCDFNDGESLAQYAMRMLKTYQRVATEISYTRRFLPNIYPSDVVELNYPAQKIFGRFIVTDQTIDLGYGAKTSEEVMELPEEE